MRPRRSPSEPLRSHAIRGFHATRGLLLLVICFFAERSASSQESTTPSVAESIANEIRSVFERTKKCVVRIEASDEHGQLSGSGFYVDPAGTIYTSYTIG